MSQADTALIFSFRVFDAYVREMCLSTFKATLKVVTGSGGVVLEGTSERAATGELDEHGRYRRIATGWGALP